MFEKELDFNKNILSKEELESLFMILNKKGIDTFIISLDDYTIKYSQLNKELWKLPHDKILNLKCYEFIKARNKPCENCKKNILVKKNDLKYIIEETYFNPQLNRYFNIISKLIVWNSKPHILYLISSNHGKYKYYKDILEDFNLINRIMNNIEEGIILTDLNGKILYFNEIIKRWTGKDISDENIVDVLIKDFDLTNDLYLNELKKLFKEINYKENSRLDNLNTSMNTKSNLKNLNIIGQQLWAKLDNSKVKTIHDEFFNSRINQEGSRKNLLHTNMYSESIISIKISELATSKKEIDGYIFFIQDITKNVQNTLDKIREQKFNAFEQIVGGILHDFNNILMRILGNIYLIKNQLGNDPNIEKFYQNTEEAIMDAKKLTSQIISFAKSGIKIQKKIMYIQNFLKDIVEFNIKGTEIKAKYFIEQNLPPIYGDKTLIRQVISNIVINARHAMNDKGSLLVFARNILVDSTNSILTPGSYILIKIVDFGKGIKKEHLARLFEPYFTTKKYGHGLGLATSYAIIKEHRGYITINSEEGLGTSVYIYLPTAKECKNNKPIKQNLEGYRSYEKEKSKSKKKRILIMDDEQSILTVLSEMLKTLGYDVDTTKEGAETIKKYKISMEENRVYDYVILDLVIKNGMDGEETIKRLKKIDPNIKAIVSSGYTKKDIITNYTKYGFIGVLKKPYTFEQLKQLFKEIQ
ncbi:MAG: hybrid sensor histidine kinase/response regulator [Promethearchaeota archaeon]